MKKIRIVLADDHQLFRRGLRVLLEQQADLTVVAEAKDGREAVATVQSLKPDVLVVDIGMQNLNGIEATRQLTESHSETAIVILSMHSDESFVLRALKAGARGYVLKASPENDLINAIRLVHQGKSFFSPSVSRMLVEDYVRQLQDKDRKLDGVSCILGKPIKIETLAQALQTMSKP